MFTHNQRFPSPRPQAPTFTKPLRNIETAEGTNVHLECRLQPVGDNSMRVEWFVNDQPLKVGTYKMSMGASGVTYIALAS